MIEDITGKMIEAAGFYELNAMLTFLHDPSDRNWREIAMARLFDEREKLSRQGGRSGNVAS